MSSSSSDPYEIEEYTSGEPPRFVRGVELDQHLQGDGDGDGGHRQAEFGYTATRGAAVSDPAPGLGLNITRGAADPASVKVGLSIRKVREAVQGKAEYIDRALEVLVREEWMEAPAGHGPVPLRAPALPGKRGPRPCPGPCPDRVPEPLGEHSGDRVPCPPIGDTGQTAGDSVSRDRVPNPGSGPPRPSDLPLFGAGVEEADV